MEILCVKKEHLDLKPLLVILIIASCQEVEHVIVQVPGRARVVIRPIMVVAIDQY